MMRNEDAAESAHQNSGPQRVDSVEAADLTLEQRVARLLMYRPTCHTSQWTREAEAVLLLVQTRRQEPPR